MTFCRIGLLMSVTVLNKKAMRLLAKFVLITVIILVVLFYITASCTNIY